MAFDSKEYTRLRDIAQKRIKRGQAAGYGLDGVKVPTVKELRQRGEYAQQIEMMRLQQFLQTGFSLERRRQASRETLTEEQRRERRREQSRDYRRRKKTYDYEPVKGKKYREYLKGVKTYNSLDEIFDVILKAIFKVQDNSRRFNQFKYVVFEFTGTHPPYGCTSKQYMSWIPDNCKEIKDGIISKDNERMVYYVKMKKGQF